MIRLHQHSSSSAARTYYKQMIGSALTSYYTSDVTRSLDDGEPTIGRVSGKLADQLSLAGGMTEDQFNKLVDGNAVDPLTGDRLRKRQNRNGQNRVGVDITFDPGGKALSAYFARTRDPLVLQLFDEARDETMVRDVEPRMMVRVRKDGASHSTRTGNALWTSFTGLVARPTKVKNEATGKWEETFTVDPHLHDHNYVFQYTFDSEYINKDGSKGAYLSADTSKIWQSKPYIQQAFHARLFKKLRDAGFNVERTEHGLDLAGWTEEMSQKFSRRKEEIEDWAKRHGIEHYVARSKGGTATRGGKVRSKLSMEDQFQEWRERLSDESWDAFLNAARGDQPHGRQLQTISPDEAIDYGLGHVLERDNSATIEEIMAAALDVGMGLDVDELRERLLAREDVVSAWFGSDLIISTQDMLKMEQDVIDRTVLSQGNCLPLGRADFEFQPFDSGSGKMVELNDNQKQNIQKLVNSTNRIMTLRGDPGVGKTAALGTQLFRAVEENGGRVLALGATSNARDQLIQFGVESGQVAAQNARTLAKFLGDESVQQEVDERTLVVLDETTLAGLKDLEPLTKSVVSRGGRLLLVGDFRQMDAVQRHGKIFEQLCRIGDQAEFTEIVRQRDPDYRRAATLTSTGTERDIMAGFDTLQKLGYVQEFKESRDRIEQAADVYLNITGEKKNNRGQRLNWSATEKQDPAMYRSGMTVIVGNGKEAQKMEVIGRDQGQVVVSSVGKSATVTGVLDMSQPDRLTVYEANYQDAILVVGTHKQGEKITRKIRSARKLAGELGIEHQFERLENVGFSDKERQNPNAYKPDRHVIEFTRKATTMRRGSLVPDKAITYGEQFVVGGLDEDGRRLMSDRSGDEFIVPTQLSDRFDVFQQKSARVAIGDKIRMTKGGRLLPDGGKQEGVRFSNNDVFTVKGYDKRGDLIVDNGHRLSQDWQHWRFGYYKTSMSAQGSTSSHNIFVDSQEAGKSRSREAWLVSVTRGKYAATILTDDAYGLRNEAILRSSQRHSSLEVAAQANLQSTESATENPSRLEKQKRWLNRVDDFARAAVDLTMKAIRNARQRLSGKLAEPVIQFPRRDSLQEPMG